MDMNTTTWTSGEDQSLVLHYYEHGISDKSKINYMCGFQFFQITTIM